MRFGASVNSRPLGCCLDLRGVVYQLACCFARDTRPGGKHPTKGEAGPAAVTWARAQHRQTLETRAKMFGRGNSMFPTTVTPTPDTAQKIKEVIFQSEPRSVGNSTNSGARTPCSRMRFGASVNSRPSGCCLDLRGVVYQLACCFARDTRPGGKHPTKGEAGPAAVTWARAQHRQTLETRAKMFGRGNSMFPTSVTPTPDTAQ